MTGDTRRTRTLPKRLHEVTARKDCLQAEEKGFTRNPPCWHCDLGLPAPRTVTKLISAILATQSVVLYLAALANKYTE